ncbi:MAG: hypothetical protein ACLFMM_00650 [Methanohalobium sp.]|uniref:hypothetical protein n=1 Tax=Methanohalobium sp. TaxID=2837493 RepID=UPI00397B0514
METCTICGDIQDSKQYEGYNICTACVDIIEDIMTEYFIKTLNDNKPKAFNGFINYVHRTSKYTSDYKKIVKESSSYTQRKSNRVATEMKFSEYASKQRYFEHMHVVLEWLKNNPEFYHQYFKDYYVCPSCNASLFEKFTTSSIGDWFVVSCSNCKTHIKKYYSPKMV